MQSWGKQWDLSKFADVLFVNLEFSRLQIQYTYMHHKCAYYQTFFEFCVATLWVLQKTRQRECVRLGNVNRKQTPQKWAHVQDIWNRIISDYKGPKTSWFISKVNGDYSTCISSDAGVYRTWILQTKSKANIFQDTIIDVLMNRWIWLPLLESVNDDRRYTGHRPKPIFTKRTLSCWVNLMVYIW